MWTEEGEQKGLGEEGREKTGDLVDLIRTGRATSPKA